jgi:uridine phosphorylase
MTDVGPLAIMVSSENDLRILGGLLQFKMDRFSPLFMSKLFIHSESPRKFCVVGPVIGAAYAAMLLEKLIVGGAVEILFFGWCGAVAHDVEIGDIIVPSGAVIDEGTSKHYLKNDGDISETSVFMMEKTILLLERRQLDFHNGVVWTTDAIYRETREKVAAFQQRNILAVEMETSALFSVGQYRKVSVGSILVVSDDLSTMRWQPGFKDSRFINNRRHICEAIESLCTALHN